MSKGELAFLVFNFFFLDFGAMHMVHSISAWILTFLPLLQKLWYGREKKSRSRSIATPTGLRYLSRCKNSTRTRISLVIPPLI